MKVVCIIQARTGSTRLPGKVLKKICGKTVLEHEIERIKKSHLVDEIVIATTTYDNDDLIVEEAKRMGVKYFRGSEEDVLSRYYLAAKENNADVIVRVTSDCPCLDYEIMDKVINAFKEKNKSDNVDYVCNTIERTFPRGYDIEVFSFDSLQKAYMNAEKDFEREHVTPYIYDKANNFNKFIVKNNEDYSEFRVTLDTEEDFIVINSIFEALYEKNNYFGIRDVVNFLLKNKDIVLINSKVEQKKLGQ